MATPLQAVEDAVFLVRQSALVQEERVQAFLDATTLASEQVQDKRIELVETPREVSASETWATVFLMIAVESTVGGKLLVALTSKLFSPVMKRNVAFRKLVSAGAGQIDAILLEAAKAKLTHEEVRRYHDHIALQGKGVPGAQQNEEDLRKRASEWWQTTVPPRADPPGGKETLGVQLLASAQTYASCTRAGIAREHAYLEGLVRANKVKAKGLTTLATVLNWEALDEDLSVIRDRYMRVFEAVIWAGLYGLFAKEKYFSPNNPFPGVDKKLEVYWRSRFARAIEDWHETHPPGIRPLLQRGQRFESQSVDKQNSDLRNWFVAIGKSHPYLPKDALTAPVR